MNKLICKQNKKGMKIEFNGDKFRLVYPGKIWESYPEKIKEVLVDNLCHLLTINVPLIAGLNNLKYNTSAPFFRNAFYSMVVKSIPSAIENYDMNTTDVLKDFMKVKFDFADYNSRIPDFEQKTQDNTAVILLSFGKDSLTSLGVCNEIGLELKPVYINETVSPTENEEKIKRVKIFRNKLGFETTLIKNEVERLNDFEYWKKDVSCLSYMHMVTAFCFISLPVSNYFKARYIVVGNEKEMDFTFINQDGFLTYPSPDQTTEWLKQQNNMIKLMTKNVDVISIIEPLTNIALMKILHTRYRVYGKYQLSCGCLDTTEEKRWCHECSQCAMLYLFSKANGIDVKGLGFHKDLFEKKYIDYYALFGGEHVDGHEKTKQAKDEQLLAFYMAYKNGENGKLVELFKNRFLDEAREREDELMNFFFGIHKSHAPPEIRHAVESIYKEELGNT